MRGISEAFIEDLITGKLAFFLDKVRRNKDISLEIRGNYIGLYYKGGRLLKITKQKNEYEFKFDSNYCLNKGDDSNFDLFSQLNTHSIQDYEENFNKFMFEMDSWFVKHPKEERRFQHNLLISNNNIVDIEYQIGRSKRFDMILVDQNNVYIVENKYGISAISSRTNIHKKVKSGLRKHYIDFIEIISSTEQRKEMIASINNCIYAKRVLGLSDSNARLGMDATINILFVLVNYNKNSKTLRNEVDDIKTEFADKEKLYPARILLLKKEESVIELSKAEDLFECVFK